jgi:hypothetical protein
MSKKKDKKSVKPTPKAVAEAPKTDAKAAETIKKDQTTVQKLADRRVSIKRRLRQKSHELELKINEKIITEDGEEVAKLNVVRRLMLHIYKRMTQLTELGLNAAEKLVNWVIDMLKVAGRPLSAAADKIVSWYKGSEEAAALRKAA